MTQPGAIEVRKEGSKTWHVGRIVEVGKKGVKVAFDGDVWPTANYSFADVRKPPRGEKDLEDFNPAHGDEVQLKVSATEHSPAGWASATVRNIKQGFYFVARVSTGAEDIVEKDKLRPVSTAPAGVNGTGLETETYSLPAELQSWMTTPDAIGCFSHIEEQSGLLFMGAMKGAKPKMQLHGTGKAITRAKMLLEVHVKHQVKIQRFQDMREQGLKALETKRSRIEGTGYKHSIEFQVDPSFIARIIGKGGENITSTQKKHDVNIRILEGDDMEEKTVRIFGNTLESIEAARADIEFVEDSIDVEPSMFSWILGRGGRTIQNFKDSCELVYARVDRDNHKLLVCGSRAAVNEAMAMFETHMMYFPVFSQMDKEMEEIVGHLEEYGDYNARWEYGWYRNEEDQWDSKGGKGGGKGGKGGGSAPAGGKASKGKDGGKDSGKGGKEAGKGGKDSKGGKDAGKGGKDAGKGGKDAGKDSKGGKDGGKGGKDAGKEGKGGKDGGKDGGKEAGKGKSKGDEAGKGKSKGKSKRDDPPVEDEEDSDSPPQKGKAAKGAGKAGGKGKTWQAKQEANGDDDDDDEESRGGKGKGARPQRSSRVARAGEDAPGGSAPRGERRMGKKGVRS